MARDIVRIADIVGSPTDCYEAGAVSRKIANARDQLFTFIEVPDLLDRLKTSCERA